MSAGQRLNIIGSQRNAAYLAQTDSKKTQLQIDVPTLKGTDSGPMRRPVRHASA